ncbi:sugar phosphate exchanger 3-like [Dysidea avara]|uniref:sugar phosphate exchanger 3-like n=1 Tax=Dysidea avara TaxID=196820 RepID=UPI0033244CBE
MNGHLPTIPDMMDYTHQRFGMTTISFLMSYYTRIKLRFTLETWILPFCSAMQYGMMLSAIMVFTFGCVGKWAGVYSVYYYGVLWGLNGLLQSAGWPTTVAIMGNWFGQGSHGVIFGVWSANASVGNIIDTFLAASVLHYGYQVEISVESAYTYRLCVYA